MNVTKHKRFIAGAVCPHCQASDTIAIWFEIHEEIVQCVACNYRMGTVGSENYSSKQEEIIGMFKPE